MLQNSGLFKSIAWGAIGEVCKGGGHLLYGVYAGIISYVLAYPDIICQKYFEERVDQLQRQQM